MNCLDVFDLIRAELGPEAHRHLGIDAPSRRDTTIAGGSYRAPGTLVDGFRAGDADMPVTGIAVTPRASLEVLKQAKASGANLVISRQAFLGDSQDRPVARPEPALAEKIRFITDNGLAVLRLQDPRIGTAGQRITAALPRAIGLSRPLAGMNPAAGLVYHIPPTPTRALLARLRQALSTSAFRLVGEADLTVRGVAFATETSRPNALAPLLARPDVNLVIAGEVHETETTAYVLDAIALGLPKALLLTGSIALEECPARDLAAWLAPLVPCPVTFAPTPDYLTAL